MDCYCGSNQGYISCCGKYLDSEYQPQTAEMLMRSRYCAYVRKNRDYLLKTWHKLNRPQRSELSFNNAVKWLGLKIVSIEKGGAEDDSGVVEFVARYKLNGKAIRIHEKSLFCRINDQWFYLEADVT